MGRTRFCVEGICFVVITAFIIGGALIRQINLLLIVAGILIGVFLMNLRLLFRTLAKLEVTRTLPSAVGAGEPFTILVKAANRKRRLGAWGVWVDFEIIPPRWGSDRENTKLAVFFPYLAAGADAIQRCDGCLHHRGIYQFGPVRVSTRFPLGLLRRTLSFRDTAKLIVYPRMGRIQPSWLAALSSRQLGVYQSQHRSGLTEGEFHGLRNWREGDSARWIHWRTTAKRNKLTIREFERQRNHDLAILLELRLDRGNEEMLERSIRFVATLIADHCRRGRSQLALGIAGDENQLITGVSSTGFMLSCMEKLATASFTCDDRLPELFCQLLPKVDSETQIIAVGATSLDLRDTTRFEQVWDQPALRHILPRVICVAVDDPAWSEIYTDVGERSIVAQETHVA